MSDLLWWLDDVMPLPFSIALQDFNNNYAAFILANGYSLAVGSAKGHTQR
jgi:hypothetical protein